MNKPTIGRRPAEVDLVRLKELLDLGVPRTKISITLGVCRRTLYKIIKENAL